MLLWLAVSAQMIAWAWFSWRGGKLSDSEFLFFTAGMLLGQLGAAIETYETGAWRAFVVQLYFFAFTLFGGVQRFRRLRSIKR
jgi:hypothetical protein